MAWKHSGSTTTMTTSASSSTSRSGNRLGPYFFLARRRFREARVRAYIVRQHRRGRPISEIVDDPCLARYGTCAFVWRVVCQAETIAALEADVREDIESCRSSLADR